MQKILCSANTNALRASLRCKDPKTRHRINHGISVLEGDTVCVAKLELWWQTALPPQTLISDVRYNVAAWIDMTSVKKCLAWGRGISIFVLTVPLHNHLNPQLTGPFRPIEMTVFYFSVISFYHFLLWVTSKYNHEKHNPSPFLSDDKVWDRLCSK